jgi:hypothetical protein
MMQNSGPIGRATRAGSHGSSSCQPQSSMPISRRRPPLPRRTRIEPRRRSRSASRSASASSMRRPARHNTTMSPRSRRPGVQALAGDAHDRDDLLDGGRVGWIAQSFVARRVTGVKAGHRRRRLSTAGGIKNDGSGHGLCRGYGRQANRSPQTARERHHQAASCLGHRAKATGTATGRHGRCSVAWRLLHKGVRKASEPKWWETERD